MAMYGSSGTMPAISAVAELLVDVTVRELLDVKLEDSRLGLEASGLVSNANYNVKRAIFLLFINSQCSFLKFPV